MKDQLGFQKEWVARRPRLQAPVIAIGSIPYIYRRADFPHRAIPSPIPIAGNITLLVEKRVARFMGVGDAASLGRRRYLREGEGYDGSARSSAANVPSASEAR